MARIDLRTVDTLQLYAPRASTVDQKIVKGSIPTGEVFCNFSRSERAAIWGRLRSHGMCDGIVPSLHTFFCDVLYLEVCANAVKRLVALNKHHPTIRRALVHRRLKPRSADSRSLTTNDCRWHTARSGCMLCDISQTWPGRPGCQPRPGKGASEGGRECDS